MFYYIDQPSAPSFLTGMAKTETKSLYHLRLPQRNERWMDLQASS